MSKAKIGGETDLGSVLHDASAKVKRRGLIVLITDCFGDVPAMLRGLANVPVLCDEHVKLLQAFVDGGGALIIFPGDHPRQRDGRPNHGRATLQVISLLGGVPLELTGR